jgi:hypothetical protein
MQLIKQKKAKSISKSDKEKFDLFYSKLREPKKIGWANYEFGSEDRIASRLQIMGFRVYDFEIDLADYKNYFVSARYLEDFPSYYPFNLPEKSLEHYLAAKLLNLNEKDVYIDIASENSPVPEIYQRLFGSKTYRQDVIYPPGMNRDMIGGDASNMPVPSEFATKMALHCSFEHFEGDSDIEFVRETSRILTSGGRVCIVPLYILEEYAIQTDPLVDDSSEVHFEDDAIVYCAKGWGNRHSRFYDPEHLVTRVCNRLAEGMQIRFYRFVNFQNVHESCYVRFAIVIEKTKNQLQDSESHNPNLYFFNVKDQE